MFFGFDLLKLKLYNVDFIMYNIGWNKCIHFTLIKGDYILTEQAFEAIFKLDKMQDYQELFGDFDRNIKTLEQECDVEISLRNNALKICGDQENVNVALDVLEQLLKVIQNDHKIDTERLIYAIDLARKKQASVIYDVMTDVVAMTQKGKQVRPKSAKQQEYVKLIKNKTIVFCEGPAGTGKTYLAIAMAVVAFKAKQISKIILTRPAVEAGESLGFLPGDLQEKVDPYLRPLFDALQEFMGDDRYEKLVEKGSIEVAPLAFMRGRTLKDSFVILDEAQNCTPSQMKMFLTRLGENSKMVVTGDGSQSDLPHLIESGLNNAINVLDGISDIGVVKFTEKDVVRHNLVQKILNAYEKEK